MFMEGSLMRQSPFLLIYILCFGEVLDVLLERLIVCAGFLNVLPILGPALLKIFDFLVQLDQRT
jgi:hypothetical protein